MSSYDFPSRFASIVDEELEVKEPSDFPLYLSTSEHSIIIPTTTPRFCVHPNYHTYDLFLFNNNSSEYREISWDVKKEQLMLDKDDIELFVLKNHIYMRIVLSYFKLNPKLALITDFACETLTATISHHEFYACKLFRDKTEVRLAQTPTQVTFLTPIQDKGLEVVLRGKARDFTITSEDGGRFPVHSFLFGSLWHFFEAATSVEMLEKESKTLHLPFPKLWIQTLVQFFYGKDLELTLDTAIGLLEVSTTYDIPELKRMICDFIPDNCEDLDLEGAVLGWKNAHVAGCSDLQDVFATFLKPHLSEVEHLDASKGMTDPQLLELLFQAINTED